MPDPVPPTPGAWNINGSTEPVNQGLVQPVTPSANPLPPPPDVNLGQTTFGSATALSGGGSEVNTAPVIPGMALEPAAAATPPPKQTPQFPAQANPIVPGSEAAQAGLPPIPNAPLTDLHGGTLGSPLGTTPGAYPLPTTPDVLPKLSTDPTPSVVTTPFDVNLTTGNTALDAWQNKAANNLGAETAPITTIENETQREIQRAIANAEEVISMTKDPRLQEATARVFERDLCNIRGIPYSDPSNTPTGNQA